MTYKNVRLDCGYRIDLLVNDWLIVELRAVESLSEVHLAQCMTCLKLMDLRLCLLMNFNIAHMRDGGIRRVVRNLK